MLVYEVDQTPFKRRPARIIPAQGDGAPPRHGCVPLWNAPLGVGRGEVRTLRLSGLRVEALATRADGSYLVRVVTS